ncbi:Trigger factor [Roseimaritima multifibrata]|uniref:Trigger factor n=1 Tax=Roseimaritima multifibrata TaxID=1930274 RepID=A0A517MCS6_9BACT|nr:trigger factor [Roseimaritima multifibrata]QDS92692.1 Trigger factor [Roseimaritima multifibrata]
MSTTDLSDGIDSAAPAATLQLDIKVESPQACLRHVVVTIPRAEVERYLQKEYDELVPEAQVPGFRAGRAPRKLVEKQFKERVIDRVKGSLLMDSLSKITDDAPFSAISEPDFDYDSIDLPDDGDFRFEFKVEVRPEFKTPEIKDLELTRSVEEITEDEVSESLDSLLRRYGSSEPTDEAAILGDKLLITAKFKKDGQVVTEMEEETVDLVDVLTFSDARCDGFGELMTGVKEGESRTGKVTIGQGVDDEEMRGQEFDVEFHVVEVTRYTKPEMTPSFLLDLGDFESVDELRDFVRDSLTRQAEYRQQQDLRQQVTQTLTADAAFELPPDLVRRQTRRELERKVLEFRRSGFSEDQIRNFVNALRQNAQASTESALREHFILEQIAEEQKVDADESDYDDEIELIAEQSDMPPRRVRARLEKSGQMDALRNQIVERKVVEMITEQAKITEKPAEKETEKKANEFAVYHNVLRFKDSEAIPEAKYDNNPNEEKDSKDKDKS